MVVDDIPNLQGRTGDALPHDVTSGVIVRREPHRLAANEHDAILHRTLLRRRRQIRGSMGVVNFHNIASIDRILDAP